MLNTYDTGGKKKRAGGGGSTRSSGSGSGHHVPRRGAVTDDRRAERERQIAIMDTLISDFEQSTSGIGDELHLQMLAGTVDQPGDMDGSTVGRRSAGSGGSGGAAGRGGGGGPIVGNSGSHHGGTLETDRAPAPSGAIENARRFLWDDTEDTGIPAVTTVGLGLSDPSTLGRSGQTITSSSPTSGRGTHHSSNHNSIDSLGSMGSLGSIDSRGRGGSRYRAGGGPGAGGAVSAFGGEFAPGYSGDSGNLYRDALKANRTMPGRGSDPDLLDNHIGKMSRDPSSRNRNFADALTGQGRRRASMDITGVFSNIQASLGKAFHGSSSKYDSKNMMWDSINFEANIAPRRPSDSDDEFADYIDRQIANDYATGPSWMESASERIVDGFGRAGYVLGDCCDSTTRAARNNRRTLLLVAAAAIIAVIGTVSVNANQESHNGSRLPSSSSSSSGTIRSPPSTTTKATKDDTATHTVTTTPQVINIPSSSKDTAKKEDAPRTSFGTIMDSVDETSRYGIIRQRILESGLSEASDLDNISANPSPQHKALKWLADMDGASLDPQHHGLLQRYSLAVLFFSTFLSSELPDLESLKKMDHLQPVTQLGEGWKDRTNWLTAKGHCSWNGVQCHRLDGTSPTLTVYNDNGGVTVLNLTANNLEGTLPSEIQGLGDLRTLDLGDNLLEGTLPPALGHLSQLELLLLDGNGFVGSIPKTLGYLENAQHISMNNNYLVGKIPEELSDMSKLTILSLYRNQLTGSLPHFEGLVNLRDLYLDANNLSGELPHSLANLRNLVDLRVGNNELTGTIPLKMCEMEKLQTLYLEKNFLGGTMPDCIDIMSSLVELQLFNNGIGGSIPESIGDLQNLELLYIDGNQISGPLPSSIGKLANLKSLYAHNNNLTGSIPEDVSKLGNLQRLYLHQNELEGPVPSELGALTRVEKIRLHQNNLSGKVPSDVCMLKDHSLVDLQGDCGTSGKIQCECCTECH